MAVITVDCPYCHSMKATASSHGHCELRNTGGVNLWALFQCHVCHAGFIAVYAAKHANPHSFGQIAYDPDGQGWRLIGVLPRPREHAAPRFTPDHVARVYVQATKNIDAKNWDAAGGMARKALDVATVALAPELKGMKLGPRIDDLHKRGRITADLKDWAHEIRIDGNDAAHDPDLFEEHEAKSIVEFTEIFLEYVYLMPGMLSERRAARAADAAKAQQAAKKP